MVMSPPGSPSTPGRFPSGMTRPSSGSSSTGGSSPSPVLAANGFGECAFISTFSLPCLSQSKTWPGINHLFIFLLQVVLAEAAYATVC